MFQGPTVGNKYNGLGSPISIYLQIDIALYVYVLCVLYKQVGNAQYQSQPIHVADVTVKFG